MNHGSEEKRCGEERRTSPARKEILDFDYPGTDSEKRESIIDRREDGQRSLDRIMLDELKRMQ